METYEIPVTRDITEVIELFDRLDGKKQLELISLLLEKMENGEIVVKGKPVYPEEIGIDDCFDCCSTIMYMLFSRY